MTARFSRRALIAAGGGLVLGAAAAGTALVRRGQPSSSSAGPSSTSTTRPPTPGEQVQAIATVGIARLATGASPTALHGFDVSGGDEVLAQFRELAPRVHDDFGQSRTMLVDGWALARTEADAAGLVALELTGRAPR